MSDVDKVTLTLDNGQHAVFHFKKGDHYKLIQMTSEVFEGKRKPMLLELKALLDVGYANDIVKEHLLRYYWKRMQEIELAGQAMRRNPPKQ